MAAGGEHDPASTESEGYARRLERTAWWKRWLGAQAPYRWNLRRQSLGRTLDVGCGVGRNLESLDPGSVGVDHNETSVRIARERGLNALTVDEWRASAPRVPELFDGLLVAHVIEHMDRDAAADLLRSYLPHLRPGGVAFLICPQERGYASDATHVCWTTCDDLVELARSVGLVPERWKSFPFPRWTGRWFTYNEFCLRARKP